MTKQELFEVLKETNPKIGRYVTASRLKQLGCPNWRASIAELQEEIGKHGFTIVHSKWNDDWDNVIGLEATTDAHKKKAANAV